MLILTVSMLYCECNLQTLSPHKIITKILIYFLCISRNLKMVLKIDLKVLTQWVNLFL